MSLRIRTGVMAISGQDVCAVIAVRTDVLWEGQVATGYAWLRARRAPAKAPGSTM